MPSKTFSSLWHRAAVPGRASPRDELGRDHPDTGRTRRRHGRATGRWKAGVTQCQGPNETECRFAMLRQHARPSVDVHPPLRTEAACVEGSTGRPFRKGGPVSELQWEEIDGRAVDTVRVLAADAVEKVGNGHPGTAMSLAPAAYLLYQRVLRH